MQASLKTQTKLIPAMESWMDDNSFRSWGVRNEGVWAVVQWLTFEIIGGLVAAVNINRPRPGRTTFHRKRAIDLYFESASGLI